MSEKKLYLIFSRPPEDVSDDEWHSWYEHHLRNEILPTPGFISGQRFAVTATGETKFPYTHLALYEYEGNWQDWEDALNQQVADGLLVQPDFQQRIAFAYMDCEPLSPRYEKEE